MKTSSQDNREKIEVEAKFICPEGFGLEDLLIAINITDFKYTRENPCFQRDVYLDTSDYTFLKSDAALRIRQRGESYVGAYKSCVKQLDTIFERKEFEWTLSNEETRRWTEERKPTIPPAIIEKLNLQGQVLRKVLSGKFEQLKQFTSSLQSQLKLQPAIGSKYKKGMILVGKYGTKISTQYGSQ